MLEFNIKRFLSLSKVGPQLKTIQNFKKSWELMHDASIFNGSVLLSL